MKFLCLVLLFLVQVALATSDDTTDEWFKAVETGDTDTMERMLREHGEDLLERKDETGKAAVFYTSYQDQRDVLELLILWGANIEATDNAWWTPLHWALLYDSIQVVQLLIKAGANIEAKNRFGETPLHWAVYFDSIHAVQLLIEAGANIEAKDNFEKTPLHWAVTCDSIDTVQLLIEAGANIEAKDHREKTPLHRAVFFYSIYAVQLLIEAGANIEAKDVYQKTPLVYARYNSDMVRILTTLPFLRILVLRNNIDTIKYLVEEGGLITIYDSNGQKSPLYWALLNSSMDVLMMDVVDWNEHLKHDQDFFNLTSEPPKKTEPPIGNVTEGNKVGSDALQKQQEEVVLCNNLRPGLRRFANGIDITTLDLLPLNSIKTDGFRKPLLDYTCKDGETWKLDNIVYDIPDQISSLQIVPTGRSKPTVDIYTSREQIKSAMEDNVQFSASIEMNYSLASGKGKFSGSQSVKTLSEEIEQQDKTIVKATSFISVYKAIIDAKSHFKPSHSLKSAIHNLPLTLDHHNMEIYINFIKDYGTHYFTEASFGGYMMQISKVSSEYAKKHSDKDIKQKASAELEKKKMGVKAKTSMSAESSNKETKTNEDFGENGEDELYCYGGDMNKEYYEWSQTVSEAPWLYSGSLEPILMLIEDKQKRESMRKAVLAYMENARAIELGQQFDVELCAFAFGDGCSADRDNCARINQWTAPVTFRNESGHECRLNWQLRAASPSKWMKERVGLCFKYSVVNKFDCRGFDYRPSYKIETPDEKLAVQNSRSLHNSANTLINCVGLNDWTGNYIHYNGKGCKMTWSLFVVGDAGDSVPEWTNELYFCWRTVTFEGNELVTCSPVINGRLSHFSKNEGQMIDGQQMEWGVFTQDFSTEKY